MNLSKFYIIFTHVLVRSFRIRINQCIPAGTSLVINKAVSIWKSFGGSVLKLFWLLVIYIPAQLNGSTDIYMYDIYDAYT